MKKPNLIPISILLLFLFVIACKDESREQAVVTEMDTTTYARVDANTNPMAAEKLALYAYGMAITQSYDCSNPASWYYQGSMHALPARDEISGVTDTLCPAYDNKQTLRAWNSCPHMYDTDKQLNFLTWHRLYTYYYERNIRHQIANGNDIYPGLGDEVAARFSLPYWDYTNQATMASSFSESSLKYDTIYLPANPLYETGRSRTLMEGDGIDYEATDSIAINVDGSVKNLCLKTIKEALNYDKFLDLGAVSEFSRGMEDRLHNVMHDYIGGAVDTLDQAGTIYNRIYQNSKSGFGLMGQIPSAGFDPIFFLHHANVDRMFAAWEAMYGPITIEDMNNYAGTWEEVGKIYQFWDSPTNSWITYNSMQEMLDAAHAVPYTYEYLPSVPVNTELMERPAQQTALVAEKTMKAPQRLTKTGEAMTVQVANTRSRAAENSRYTLEVELAFGSNMFQQLLVISIPPGMDWTACDLDPDYIHAISAFFGSTHEMHAGMHGPAEAGQEFSHTILADVTKAVKNLPEGEELEVFIVPLNTENGPDFYVKKLTLFERQ